MIRTVVFLIYTGTLLMACNKKQAEEAAEASKCATLKRALIVNSKPAVTREVQHLFTTYDSLSVIRFADSLSKECGLTAKMTCYNCYTDFTEVSVIKIQFSLSGQLIEKFINIGHTSPGNQMYVQRVHQ